MQKLLTLPLAVMLLLSLVSFVSGGNLSNGSIDLAGGGSIDVNGTSGSVNLPNQQAQSFNIWTTEGAIVILIAVLAVGIVAGVTVFGSGISTTAQKMIILGTGLFGLWACLSITSQNIFSNGGVFGSIIWIALTIMYVLGFIMQATGGDASD